MPEEGWRPALEMPGAEIAETTYRPSGWAHEPLRLLIRRRLLEVAELGSGRARRRRTVPLLQLQLALNGSVSQVYGYSFLLTDIARDATEIELWQRQRAHIEERIKDAKLGCGLIHLPLGTLRANRGWQAAAVIAVNLVAMLSAVTSTPCRSLPSRTATPSSARTSRRMTNPATVWPPRCAAG